MKKKRKRRTNLFDCGGLFGGDAVHFETGLHGGGLTRFFVVDAVGLDAAAVRRVGRGLLAAVAVAGRDLGRRGRRHARLFEFHLLGTADGRRRRHGRRHVADVGQRQLRHADAVAAADDVVGRTEPFQRTCRRQSRLVTPSRFMQTQ